jgi:hypothetical protein
MKGSLGSPMGQRLKPAHEALHSAANSQLNIIRHREFAHFQVTHRSSTSCSARGPADSFGTSTTRVHNRYFLPTADVFPDRSLAEQSAKPESILLAARLFPASVPILRRRFKDHSSTYAPAPHSSR